jgi:hypothetical protein
VAFSASAASIAVQYRANHWLVAPWKDKKWDVIARSEALTGHLETQKQDLGQVRFKDTLLVLGTLWLSVNAISSEISLSTWTMAAVKT